MGKQATLRPTTGTSTGGVVQIGMTLTKEDGKPDIVIRGTQELPAGATVEDVGRAICDCLNRDERLEAEWNGSSVSVRLVSARHTGFDLGVDDNTTGALFAPRIRVNQNSIAFQVGKKIWVIGPTATGATYNSPRKPSATGWQVFDSRIAQLIRTSLNIYTPAGVPVNSIPLAGTTQIARGHGCLFLAQQGRVQIVSNTGVQTTISVRGTPSILVVGNSLVITSGGGTHPYSVGIYNLSGRLVARIPVGAGQTPQCTAFASCVLVQTGTICRIYSTTGHQMGRNFSASGMPVVCGSILVFQQGTTLRFFNQYGGTLRTLTIPANSQVLGGQSLCDIVTKSTPPAKAATTIRILKPRENGDRTIELQEDLEVLVFGSLILGITRRAVKFFDDTGRHRKTLAIRDPKTVTAIGDFVYVCTDGKLLVYDRGGTFVRDVTVPGMTGSTTLTQVGGTT